MTVKLVKKTEVFYIARSQWAVGRDAEGKDLTGFGLSWFRKEHDEAADLVDRHGAMTYTPKWDDTPRRYHTWLEQHTRYDDGTEDVAVIREHNRPEPEGPAVHIHVGANMPGYLPESEPGCFDDLESAIEYLRHELRDQQEYYAQGCEAMNFVDGCECAWCDVAGDVEAALSAIADSGPDEHFVSEGRAAWIFSPPEGADIHHWALSITTDRDACEIAQEQGE